MSGQLEQPDVYFHNITSRVSSRDELCTFLSQGLVKYIRHFHLPKDSLETREELIHVLDRWCEHDFYRGNYFQDYFQDEDILFDHIVTSALNEI